MPDPEQRDFGAVAGRVATLYTMHNTAGLSVSVTDLGATVTRILVPDRSGRVADVVLGCDNAAA
ncbi:MAG TPA: hypothetical protein VGL19_05075, partial [Polyangiaceae bacterium]